MTAAHQTSMSGNLDWNQQKVENMIAVELLRRLDPVFARRCDLDSHLRQRFAARMSLLFIVL